MTRCLHSALCRKRKPRRRRWRAEENETLLPQLGRERGRQGRWMARRARGRGTFGHYRHSSVRPSVLPPDWNPRARLAAAAVIGVISKGRGRMDNPAFTFLAHFSCSRALRRGVLCLWWWWWPSRQAHWIGRRRRAACSARIFRILHAVFSLSRERGGRGGWIGASKKNLLTKKPRIHFLSSLSLPLSRLQQPVVNSTAFRCPSATLTTSVT